MNETVRRMKARNMRYKKAALTTLGYESITDELYTIGGECSEIQYFVSDDETLLNAFDGDEEDAYEFQMMFSDLSAKCEQLTDALNDSYVTEHFDDFMVGILGSRYQAVGYDSYEEDYYALTRFESELAQTESGKRLMRLSKETLLSVSGQCLGIVISFLDLRHTYDYLKATFDILKDDHTSILKVVKDIEETYELACKDGPSGGDYTRRLNDLVYALPDRMWIE